MAPQTCLQYAGILTDTGSGWSDYEHHLHSRLMAWPQLSEGEVRSLSDGWALGSEQFRASLVQAHQPVQTARFAGAANARDAMELQWQSSLDACLAVLKPVERLENFKSATWKVAVAAAMKQHTSVNNGWLAKRLAMGSGKYVSRLVCDDRYLSKIDGDMKVCLNVNWAT